LKVFKTKRRPVFDPLILHIASVNQLSLYADEIPDVAFKLAEKFWPGPLSMVLKKREIISDLVTSGLDTVAIRIPNHPLTLKLLELLDFPLAAPSANPFGYISPTTAQHVADTFNSRIPYILDGGPCKVGIESTIVGFENDQCLVYRLGGHSLSELEAVVGKVELSVNNTSNPRAPGMLKSQNAPLKQ
jgi:L-threonylcarbamoyladenylate synthase